MTINYPRLSKKNLSALTYCVCCGRPRTENFDIRGLCLRCQSDVRNARRMEKFNK